jgi:outer membrane receptor protein involved in Fe transport
MRKLIPFLCLFISFNTFAQKMSISGTVQDTIAKTPLKNAVAMAVRIKDSVLVSFARSDENGRFELKNLKIDTVQVIVSSPAFGDQYYYVFGSPSNSEFDFGKIVLPPKTQQLNEVIIYAFKDPVYYKGDTLIYSADSFKVKPNATVEDLLKKLPGIKVDAKGKITSQGKEVSQVLVDGDEFFGSDPTVATKNLAANGVESVQVYEKKDDNATEGGDGTVQVMNLKLKDEAKKGYFGKVSGASDFQKYYEGELLANRFNKQQKISVFTLASNTPRSSFNWGDVYKYGLDNEMNMMTNDEGESYWYSNNGQEGVPQSLKSGFYYADRIGKKTKLNFNYTYNSNILNATSSTRSQFFLTDTSYITENTSLSSQKAESHTINFGIVQTLDSLTELEVRPKVVLNSTTTKSYSDNIFKTSTDTLTRENEVLNTNKAKGYELSANAKLTKKFKKKDRLLVLNYNLNQREDDADAILKSYNNYYSGVILPNDTIDQKKENYNNKQVHNAKLVYTEPLTKKIKLEFEYVFNYNKSIQDKKALNLFNGEYSLNDSIFSNNFENTQLYNRAGLKFIYETKKIRFAIGSRGQQTQLNSHNLIADTKVNYTGNALLPFMGYTYRFSENSRYNFTYYTNANQPSINQLQPVQDNTNPNRVVVGNTNLKPSYDNHFEMSYNIYKPITGRYLWASLNFDVINNAFANSTAFDSIGRTISQTVNVDGNYNGNFYIGGGLPLLGGLIRLDPNVSGYYSKNSNFVNGKTNNTQASNVQAGLTFSVETDSISFSIGGNYTWNQTQSSLNPISNKPYGEQQFDASFRWQLPLKFVVETSGMYRINSQRSQGYNINYFIWNASLSKAFLKNENLILAVEANDLLNQNISTQRTIQDNSITDTKTNIIGRYYLLRLTYKFNSTKTKETDDYGW